MTAAVTECLTAALTTALTAALTAALTTAALTAVLTACLTAGSDHSRCCMQGTCAEKLRMRKVVIVSRVVSGGFLLDLHSGFTSVLLSRSINKRRNNMLRYKYLCKWPSDRFQLSGFGTQLGA